MSKPTVFISHITEEDEVARNLKSLIERKFLRAIEVFVSSHEESIRLGDEWLTTIKDSVASCGLMIVICSPISVTRPWINFEAGAGWVRAIPVIPMCHSGIHPGELPVPLNSLQAGRLTNTQDIEKLFRRLANLANIDSPQVDDSEFFTIIQNYETSTIANVLLKDSQFIENLLTHQIGIIEHCIYTSTKDWNFFFSSEAKNLELKDFVIEFNEIYHLFDPPLIITATSTRKTFQVLLSAIFKTADNIRFILSNSHLKISPEINDLLNSFLFSLGQVEYWSARIETMEMTKPEVRDSLFKDVTKMIKEKETPPEREETPNLINMFIDYYDSLIFYKKWILDYKATIYKLVERK